MTTIKLRGARFGPVVWNITILLVQIAKSSRIPENARSIIISFQKSSALFFVPIVPLVLCKLRRSEFRAMPIP
jgi:hypothetical protein